MNQSVTQPGLDLVLASAANGDAGAWQQVVGQYAPRVYGLLLRQCGDGELAEEITQATFVKVVTRIGEYQERGKFEPWLFRVAMNRLRDEMRRRKRQARTMDMGEGRHDDEGGESWSAVQQLADTKAQRTPLDEMDHVERLEQVRLAVRQLDEDDQQIIYLRHTAGMTFAEIAATLEKPLGTVLARGHRALGKLRRILGTADEAGSEAS